MDILFFERALNVFTLCLTLFAWFYLLRKRLFINQLPLTKGIKPIFLGVFFVLLSDYIKLHGATHLPFFLANPINGYLLSGSLLYVKIGTLFLGNLLILLGVVFLLTYFYPKIIGIIEEQKKVQEHLRESEAMYRTLVDNSPY